MDTFSYYVYLLLGFYFFAKGYFAMQELRSLGTAGYDEDATYFSGTEDRPLFIGESRVREVKKRGVCARALKLLKKQQKMIEGRIPTISEEQWIKERAEYVERITNLEETLFFARKRIVELLAEKNGRLFQKESERRPERL